MGKLQKSKRDLMSDHIEKWRQDELLQRLYCKRHNIPYTLFKKYNEQYHKKKRLKQGKPASPSPLSGTFPGFYQIGAKKEAGMAGVIKLAYSNGVVLELPPLLPLSSYIDDGRYEIDNNLIENAIRPLALGRKNYLFAGSHDASRRAAFKELYAQ